MAEGSRFADRVVVITGGANNIGAAIAQRFSREGAFVVVNDLDAGAIARTVRSLGLPASSLGVAADVSDSDAVNGMFDQVVARFGRVDVVVANAADPMRGRGHLLDLEVEDWDRAFAVNARGVMLCSVGGARRMTPGASIVTVSSVGATRAHAESAAYDASKGAVEALTRAMAVDLASFGIRVNAVAPGPIMNDRSAGLDDEQLAGRIAGVPLARMGTGDEVAGVVAFLASDDAAFVTGQTVTVDGGLSIQARPRVGAPALKHIPEGARS